MNEDELGKIDVDMGFLQSGCTATEQQAAELEGRFVKVEITDMEIIFEVIQNSTNTIDKCFNLLKKRLNEKEVEK